MPYGKGATILTLALCVDPLVHSNRPQECLIQIESPHSHHISVLNALLDRVLTQPEASSSRTSFSRNEMMLDSAG